MFRHLGFAALFLTATAILTVVERPDRRAEFSRSDTASADALEPIRGGLTQLRLAAALRESGQFADALEAYDSAAELMPEVDDWILVHSANAAASAGDTARVRERLERAPRDVARDWGWRIRVNGYLKAEDHERALAIAEAAATDRSMTATRRGAAWAQAGEMRLQRGDSAGARDAALRAMDVAPNSSGIEGARLLGKLKALSPSDFLQMGRILLRHDHPRRGIEAVKAYLDARVGRAAERLAVRDELARALYNAGRYREAERVLLEVSRDAMSPSTAAAALFLAGRAQYRDGRETAARSTLLSVIDRYPKTSAAARALYLSADLDHDDGNLPRARERYRRTIATRARVEEVEIAHLRLGGLAFLTGDYRTALRTFDAYRKAYPRGRRFQQATYWSARALDKLGQKEPARRRFEEALALDPFSYYGGRAARLLGLTSMGPELEPAPLTDSAHRRAVARALARLDRLKQIGWNEAAAYELERIKDRLARTDGAHYALAEALNARGFHSAAFEIARDLYQRDGGWNLRLLRILYPFPFRNVITTEARERGVDPFLAAALIRQESTFDPGAVSSAGAIGLMQIMPSTGRSVARKLGLRRFSPELLEKPEINIKLGIAHLAEELRAHGGRLPVVLAAYNAGAGRIARWREFPEFADDELFTERIPYDETRDYVRIVQNNARLYAALYGGDGS